MCHDCNEDFCHVHEPDISQPVFMSPFTWRHKRLPKDYDAKIVRAAALFEHKKTTFYPIERFWPPKRRSSYDSLIDAARDVGVCPNDLASHVNRDEYIRERMEEEQA